MNDDPGVRTSNTSADPLRDALERLLSLYKEADDERYKEQMEHRAEAQELQKKGDGYGFNFYSGMDAGLNWTALFFYRVRRELEAMIKALPKEPEIQRVYKLVDHWHGEAVRWESEEKKRRGEIEQLTRERDEACNKLSALHEGEGSPDETKCEHGADPDNEQVGEVAGKPGSSHACAEQAPGAVKAVKSDGPAIAREIHERHQRVSKLLWGGPTNMILGPMDADAAHADRGALLSLLTPEQRGDRPSEKAGDES